MVEGKMLIGNGGAEFGVRGYVSAYDAETAQLAWRFYTVPGDPRSLRESQALEPAAKTWTGEWWKIGGGGTVWDSMAYDPELELLYVGTGNGSPWNRKHPQPRRRRQSVPRRRSSRCSPDTGELVWHYQTTPGEKWDYTAVQQHRPRRSGRSAGAQRKVLMQAPKNGFFYVLDRTNGRLISAQPFAPVNWAMACGSQIRVVPSSTPKPTTRRSGQDLARAARATRCA